MTNHICGLSLFIYKVNLPCGKELMKNRIRSP